MAKKQFIRHLEFYGFPDQNGYSSEISGVDLSDIREKNKEQDKEIQELEGEKAEKKDLLELSGTVENFIERQSEINKDFADAISGMSGDIDELKKVDDEFAEQLSAITDGVDDAMEAIEILGDRVEGLEDGLSGLSGAMDSMMETIEDEFAKKDDVYTKEEIDARIPSGETFATEEWVERQGYLTFDSGDTRYAIIEDLEALSGVVESATTGIEDEIDDIIETIATVSADTEEKFEEIEDKIDSFSGEVTSAITDIKEDIDEINDKVDENTEDIDELKDEVSAITDAIDVIEDAVKENTDDIELLQQQVSANTDDISNIYDILDTKANVSDLEELHNEMICKVEELEDKKADKTDLNAVSGAVDDLNDKLDREIERSTGVDERLTNKVNELDEQVQEAVELVGTFDGRITDVETGLTKEIADRKQADLDLIGTEEDSRDADTIWGAKNFAKEMKRQAVSEAEVYTDEAIAGFSTELATMRDEIEQELTAYATTGYVESRITETKTELEGDYNQKIENETERAIGRENGIIEDVDEIRLDVVTAKEDIAHNATIIHAITEWDGSDPDEYVDTGNGILDVLHREFHEYVKEHVNGDIKSITYEDGKLIIVYESTEGEKTVEIPIGDIVDLEDYYKKEETDALLDEKLDASAYTDVSEQVSANTSNIEVLSGDVVNLDSALAELIEKLGYKDNDTLVTNGEHEVAFGEYNISNTSEEASGETIFSIGNGTDENNRSNAVEVKKNGDVYLWIEGEFMNINKLLGQIAHEVYDNDTTHNGNFFDGE
jgi:ABC-type transporter Mla subunit MlaD